MRICIIGAKGAGKSTLACHIARITGTPCIHLDKIFWQKGWVKPPLDEWMRINEELVAKENWILDGNYFDVIRPRLERADYFIWLKRRWFVYSSRLICRTLASLGSTRPDIGLPERLHFPHIVGALTYMQRTSARFESLRADCETRNVPLHILTSQTEIRKFLRERDWDDKC